MTEDELATIEMRATKASDGEWGVLRDDIGIVEGDEETGQWVSEVFATLPTGHVVNREANAAFILRSRADVIALVAEVRRLTAELSHAGQPRYSGDASVAVDAINAAFNRGAEAMREAAAKACDDIAAEWLSKPSDQYSNDECFAADNAASGAALAIRALKVAP